MDNDHSQNKVNSKYDFLLDRKAKDVFGALDYHLKNGVHIQREYPKPSEIYYFIEKYYDELADYYKDFFQVELRHEGGEWGRYFFIDFEDGSRGKIAANNRVYLSMEHVIVGLLFLKIYKLDANFEIDSVNEFIKVLFLEYEEEKNGLLKLLADAMNEKSTTLNDKKVEDVISKAFDVFSGLGWVVKDNQDKDKFKYMPSFERLRKIYEPQILGIDELIKQQKNEK